MPSSSHSTTDAREGRLRAMRELSVKGDASGVVLPALGLHLDPTRAVPLAFVSHAHAARAVGSTVVYASPETIDRLAIPNARAIAWDGAVELPLASGGAARLSIAPAGHVPGAAQLVVDHPGGRLVYTGDVGPDAAPVECDALVLESTYALPIFRFPPRARELDALATFCRDAIASGKSPIVLARPDGEAEAIAAELAYRGISVGDKPGVRMAKVAAPAKRDGPVALASGSAMIDAVVDRVRADAAFVLSSHADSDGLVAFARKTRARHVTAVYGDAAVLAMLLRDEGIDADAIEGAPIDEGP